MKETNILTHDTNGTDGPTDLKTLVEESLDSDKAMDISFIKLDERTALADYMVVASGTSSRHLVALAGNLKDRLAVLGYKNIRIEGAERADWVIVDVGDIIIHLFRPEVREFYNIEKMWGTPMATAQLDVVEDHQSA